MFLLKIKNESKIWVSNYWCLRASAVCHGRATPPRRGCHMRHAGGPGRCGGAMTGHLACVCCRCIVLQVVPQCQSCATRNICIKVWCVKLKGNRQVPQETLYGAELVVGEVHESARGEGLSEDRRSRGATSLPLNTKFHMHVQRQQCLMSTFTVNSLHQRYEANLWASP